MPDNIPLDVWNGSRTVSTAITELHRSIQAQQEENARHERTMFVLTVVNVVLAAIAAGAAIAQAFMA